MLGTGELDVRSSRPHSALRASLPARGARVYKVAEELPNSMAMIGWRACSEIRPQRQRNGSAIRRRSAQSLIRGVAWLSTVATLGWIPPFTHGREQLAGPSPQQAAPNWAPFQVLERSRPACGERCPKGREGASESVHGRSGASPLQVCALRPVTDCNCVAARRGGKQQEVNDQSVGEQTRFGRACLASLPSHGEAWTCRKAETRHAEG